MAGIYYNARTTPADSNYARYRNNLFFIGRSVGTWFTPENLPVTADFMARVWQDASYFIWSMKYKYLRIRPVVIDSTVHNLEDTNWAAYPSGHAANSYINAYLYSELGPEFTDIFIKDAYDMAHSREIIGVHYPSDSEASRVFARQFVNKLFENEKFVADFKNVKAEWAAKAKELFIKPAPGIKKEMKNTTCAKTCD
jgi:acid phosphatase (class A)